MKMNFKTISTILILVLTGLLIGILIQFYNAPLKVTNVSTTINHLPSEPMKEEEKSEEPIVIPESGEIEIEQESGEEEAIPSDENKEEESPNALKSVVHSAITKKNDKTSQVIISSEDTMTNKEKREILTELDNTLMELLDVVNKVQTIDETRLQVDESEVQQ